MLEDLLNKQIDMIKNNAEAEIGATKYIGDLTDRFKGKFKGYSEEEVYFEFGRLIKQLYDIYVYDSEILKVNDRRSEEDTKNSFILGLEQSEGSDENVMDGYYDVGEVLSLTDKGKKLLNGYRLARGELTIDDYRKKLHKDLCDLSKEY